jgi:hypothetical protein
MHFSEGGRCSCKDIYEDLAKNCFFFLPFTERISYNSPGTLQHHRLKVWGAEFRLLSSLIAIIMAVTY